MPQRSLVWTPAAGGAFTLNDFGAGYRVMKGATGLGAPPIEITTDATPLLDGAVVTDVFAPPRTIQLPMLVLATDRTTYRARMKALLEAMSFGSECQFELAQPDGQRRRIRAYYNGGLEGWEDKDQGGEEWARFVLKILCPDPFWFDPTPITVKFENVTPVAFFPIFPVKLTTTSVLGSATVNNPGDVLAWPVWTITRPATGISIDNTDTGETLHLTGTIPSGQTLQIVTQPTLVQIALSDGTSWWDKLTGTPNLWPLRKGDNHITLAVTGAGAGSKIEGSFTPRYWSAW